MINEQTQSNNGKQQESKFIAFGVMAIALYILVIRCISVFSYSFDIGGLEQYFSFLTLMAGQGKLYNDPTVLPYVVSQYPPLYFYLANGLGKIVQVFHVDEIRSIYLAGRSISLLCNLATVYIVFRFFRKTIQPISVQRSIIPACIVFLLFIVHNFSARPDSLKILFIVLSMYLAFRYFVLKTWTYLAGLIVSSILAIITKQDATIYILAIGIASFTYNKKVSVIYIGLVGLTSLLLLVAVCKFDFHTFYTNLIIGINSGYQLDWLLNILKYCYPAILVGVLLGMLCLRILLLEKHKSIAVALILVFVTSHLSMLKWGSFTNYLIEFQILVFVIPIYFMYKYDYDAGKWIFPAIICLFLGNHYIHNYNNAIIWSYTDDKIQYIDIKQAAKEIEFGLKAEHDDFELIAFMQEESLFLSRHIILGTTINEFPKLFYPDFEKYVSSLPSKLYEYQFDCQQFRDSPTYLLSNQEALAHHTNGLNFIAKSINIDYQKVEIPVSNYRLNKISCE